MRALEKFHPITLLVYFVSVLVITMFVRHPLVLGMSLLGALLLVGSLTERKQFWKDMGFFALLLFLITVTNPIFSHNGVTPLFFLNGNPVTLEAVVYGFWMGVMVVAVLLWCQAINRIFTGDKVMYLLGRILPGISLVFSMVLRFVPRFRQKSREIMAAQKAMGFSASGSYKERIRAFTLVYSALTGWALEHSMEVGISMRARGYGCSKRTSFHLFRWKFRDSMFFFGTLLLLLITVAGLFTGKLEFVFYPALGSLAAGFDLVPAAAFGLLTLLPFILVKEEICRWNYYMQKM